MINKQRITLKRREAQMTQEVLGTASSQDPKRTAGWFMKPWNLLPRKFLITASDINGIKNFLSWVKAPLLEGGH